MQDRLKQIARGEPGEIQKASESLRQVPRDDDAIGKLTHVAPTGHAGLEKYADGRRTRAQPSTCVSDPVESSNRGSDSAVNATVCIDVTLFRRRTESKRPRRSHRQCTPPLP